MTDLEECAEAIAEIFSDKIGEYQERAEHADDATQANYHLAVASDLVSALFGAMAAINFEYAGYRKPAWVPMFQPKLMVSLEDLENDMPCCPLCGALLVAMMRAEIARSAARWEQKRHTWVAISPLPSISTVDHWQCDACKKKWRYVVVKEAMEADES